MTRILVAPMDIEAATAQLAAAQGAEPEPELVDYVAGLLFRLEELGLVERVGS